MKIVRVVIGAGHVFDNNGKAIGKVDLEDGTAYLVVSEDKYINKFLPLEQRLYYCLKNAMSCAEALNGFEKRTRIEKVIYNNPATIVFWKDGTKTVAKAQKGDRYNKKVGLMLNIIKKLTDDQYGYYLEKIFEKE